MAVKNRVLLVTLLLATIRQQISDAGDTKTDGALAAEDVQKDKFAQVEAALGTGTEPKTRNRRYSLDLERPQNPELVAINSTCVRFSWDAPEPDSQEILQGYKYYCYDNDYTNVSTSIREAVICRYHAYYRVYCRVYALYQSDESSYVYDITYTNCSNPSPPTNIVVEEPEIHIAARWQWNVTLSWQRPSTTACATITSYSLWYKVDGDIWRSQVLTEPISNVILMDGYKNLEASVSATNNGNFTSSNVTKTFTSPVLPPQFGPRNVTIRAVNPTCIKMTWMELQYPNGPIESYQVKCQKEEQYKNIGDQNTYTQCDFSPSESVECCVRAKNPLTYSEDSCSKTVFTKCEEPARPVPSVTESAVPTCNGTERVAVTVTWKASTHNCQYMKYYKVTLDSTEKLVSPWDVLEFTFRELNPKTTYSLSVAAVNNEDYASTSTTSFTTRLVRPAPPTLALTFNTSCVNVWVTGPSEPYHHISQYKLRCYYSDARAESPPLLNESASDVDVLKGSMWVRCGLPPSTKLICDASSTNAAGESALVSHEGYTAPEDLTAPEELISTEPTTSSSIIIASVIPSIVVLIIVVLIIGVVLWRRRVQPSAYKYSAEGNSTTSCASGSTVDCRPHPTAKGKRASSDNVYEELRTSQMTDRNNGRCYEHVLMKDRSIATQFERLEEAIGQMKFDYSTAKFPMNIEKNRFKDILPTSEHAVSINGADYINAVFVNSFHQENRFIATQFPLSQTTSDFWKMIHERNVNVVVQLLPEMLDYYPDTDGDEFYLDWGEMQREASSENCLVKLIHLTVEDRLVSVIKVINWSDDPQKGKEMPKISSLLYYFEAMDSYSADGNICVTDMTGSKQAGIFIAGYNLVAAIKSHQEPNLYTTVLEARKRRPQFVSDLASYTYLDEVRRYASEKTQKMLPPTIPQFPAASI